MGDDWVGQLFQDEISNRKYSWVPIGRDVTSDSPCLSQSLAAVTECHLLGICI